MELIQVYYVRNNDTELKRKLESLTEHINGKRMKYKATGFTRLRGVEYDIYELVPVSSRWWCCLKRNRIHQKG